MYLLRTFEPMKKEARINIKLSDDEKLSFERAAELEGLNLSNWIRTRLRTVCTKELKAKGEIPDFTKTSSK